MCIRDSVHAPYASGLLSTCNLTGHPAVVAPFVPKAKKPGGEAPSQDLSNFGTREDGSPRTVSFTGRLDRDEELMAIVARWQALNPQHILHPDLLK